jgi:proteasome alpha subunit
MFHILYDGTVRDENQCTALGGESEPIIARLRETWTEGLDLDAALTVGINALTGPDRSLAAEDLEVGLLDRTSTLRRRFRRIEVDELRECLGDLVSGTPSADAGGPDLDPPPVDENGNSPSA